MPYFFSRSKIKIIKKNKKKKKKKISKMNNENVINTKILENMKNTLHIITSKGNKDARSPLDIAFQNNNNYFVSLLIKKIWNVYFKNYTMRTSRHIACQLVDNLLNHDAEIH